jgi:tripartite-type tricarboxylate transporter receptor subunit TctC
VRDQRYDHSTGLAWRTVLIEVFNIMSQWLVAGYRSASRGIVLALAGMAIFSGSVAQADSVEDFYKNKRLTMIVSNDAGGINDIVGRLVARHIVKYIPGLPTSVVQNMPGAGGLTATNHMYNIAAKDGLTVAGITRSVPQFQILGDANARFDPLKFVWLGSTSSYAEDAYLLIVNTPHPAKTVADLKKPGIRIKVGTLGAATSNLVYAQIARDVLGLNVDIVSGYSGGAAIFLAMQRGEIDAQFAGLSTLTSGQKALWESKGVRPLAQFGRITRLAELSDVPLGRELTTDPKAQALIDFADLPFFMAQPFVAPPDIPADRATALQTAFMMAHRDPEFLAEAAKLGVEVSPISGERVSELLRKAAATPRDVIERYNAVVAAGK